MKSTLTRTVKGPRAGSGFNVANVNVLADELRGRGAQIIDGPEERVYGQRELVVRDCNGLILAFGEPLQTSAT